MLRNNFKIAWRNILRNKLYTFINLIGLAIGFSSCLLIVLFVTDEISYDRYFVNSDRTFRLVGDYVQGGDSKTSSALTQYQLAPNLKEAFPEIEKITRIGRGGNNVYLEEELFQESEVFFGEPEFFEILTWELIIGESAKVLDAPNKVVISEKISKKYFGDESPIGKVLHFQGLPASVSGVMRDVPANTHFHPNFVISMSSVHDHYPEWMHTNWSGTSHYTYILFEEGANLDGFPEKVASLVAEKLRFKENVPDYFLQPIADIHLGSNRANELESNGNVDYVYIFSIIAAVILVIASINYINLTTASSLYRSREIGMKKVLGAGRNQMIGQFQMESLLMTFLAAMIALVISELSIPFFNQIAEKTLPGNLFLQTDVVLGLIVVTLLVGTVAGIFPVTYILKFDLAQSLKGKISHVNRSSISLSNLLVIAQFAISIVLILGTLVILKQLNFMQNKDLGINSDHVVEVFAWSGEVQQRYETFKSVLESDPLIHSVSAAGNEFSARIGGWRQYSFDGEESVSLPTTIVELDIFKTLQAEIVEGRDFSKDFITDRTEAYVLNESAVSFLNIETPVNTSIEGSIFTGSVWGKKRAKIIGVVKDFHMASLHSPVQPVVFSLQTEGTMGVGVVMIKIDGSKINESIERIEAVWKEFAPRTPFVYEFMDEDIQRHYEAEKRFLLIVSIFTTLGILIGCLGLFGLTTFMVQHRVKEIGIRKVMGASVAGLVRLLSWKFIRLVLLANVLAWPIAFFLMEEWLQDFAYRMEQDIFVFVSSAAIALLIAFLTVSFHSIKSSMSNPVDALRME